MMTPIDSRRFDPARAAACAVLLLFATVAARAATPALDIRPDPSGARITWNASDGQDFVLEASNDYATWVQVNQSVVKEGALHRVFVPDTQAMNFYRLVNDGVRKQAAYVGSDACRTCHSTIHGQFIESGHSYKIVKVTGGVPPTYFPDKKINVPDTPAGWTWDDVSWVIGGALWKARFIDHHGYIVTGTNVQYNLATKGWVAYNAQNPVGTKPYDCGSCHTTGWVPLDTGGVPQDGMPGMRGSFALPGIQCESCHGPGSRHVATLLKTEIRKDSSAALCGQCHVRGEPSKIPASNGFIQHHEQFNEMLSTKHATMNCTTCHNPHVSATRGLAGAITRDCTACHSAAVYGKDLHSALTDCITCHMPKATRTATAANKYVADIKTHIFKINTNADGAMFTDDGRFANGATGVTLGYVCYQCHKDADGVGGSNSTKTLEQLAAKAKGFHN